MNDHRRLAQLAALAAVVSGLWLSAVPAVADTIDDYLVQQVCMDPLGNPTSEDPYYCPTRARKLQIGEHLPYHKWDLPTQSALAQISDSYPIADLFGRTRIVSNFFFTRAGLVPYFAPGNASDGDSAYDLVITDGYYASAAGTYDQGGGWQPMFSNAMCSYADSWVFAPRNQTVPFGQGQTTTTLAITYPQCPTVDIFGQSLTVWNYYPNMMYQSGKSLNTIKSWHFNGDSLNATGIEVFFFTKQYGKTRWEAWSSSAPGPDPVALDRCGVGTSGGVNQFGNTVYYLVDCHDWSFIFPAENGGWNPDLFHIDPFYNSINLLKNTHMQCTDSNGLARICGTPAASCQTIAPWNRMGNLNWGYNQNPQHPRASANCALIVSIPTGASGSVYQDTDPLSGPYANFTFGAALKAPHANGTTHPLWVSVHEFNSAGALLASHTVPASVGKSHRFIKGEFTKHPNAHRFRFEVYIGQANIIYEMTDAWVAPKP